jgi:hypothetical protein
MTLNEAQEIFKSWQDYQEIADKLHTVFSVVPESFLPYSIDTLEEALNIVAEDYFNNGNQKAAKNIQETMSAYLTGYYLASSEGKLKASSSKLTDEETIQRMKKDLDFMLENPELLEAKLKNLKRSFDSWAEFKKRK